MSEVTICNIALSRIGQTQITALTESERKARLCNLFYAEMREVTLQSNWWTFATGRQTLSQLVATPDSEYDYYYQLPTDCIDVRYLVDSTIEWVVESDRLVTDSSNDIELVYTKSVTDTTKFTPNFRDALSYRIAMELVIPLFGNSGSATRDRMERSFMDVITRASQRDKRRGHKKVPQYSGWVNARTGGVENQTRKLTNE